MYTSREVAGVCRISARTLRRWDRDGTFGPEPLRAIGRLLYDADEVDAWIECGMPWRKEWAPRWATTRRLRATMAAAGKGPKT